jgi:[NiFe] hydrogenase diaphorase moiety large subunit
MENKGLNKVDLIFEKIDSKEVLIKAFTMSSTEIIQSMLDSGLKGRGGAGFPTGLKWKYTAAEKSADKYIVCNADEGEPGTFKDREILDRVSNKVHGGMAIAGKAIGAKMGIVYLRGEYRYMLPKLMIELDSFHSMIKEIGLDFRIEYRMGSGAYICGEESALFESIEGKRGEPRNKPPYPTVSGVFNKPTSINNVETLVTAMMIIKHGAKNFIQYGTKDSRGSKRYTHSRHLRT